MTLKTAQVVCRKCIKIQMQLHNNFGSIVLKVTEDSSKKSKVERIRRMMIIEKQVQI